MGPTRRQVLSALGAALGGGAVASALSALDLTADARTAPYRAPSRGDLLGGLRVLVLGAGVAGLSCAYELQKAGHAVTVVEARPVAGGRNRTVRRGTTLTDVRGQVQRATFADGLWFDPGPARIAQHHTTLAYCRELGVPVEVFVNANPDAFVERDGVVRRRRSVDADLDGYVSELLHKVPATALEAELDADERDALLEHLRLVAGGPGRRGPGRGEARDPLSLLLGLRTGERRAFEQEWHQAMPMFSAVGGMDALPRRFVEALRGPLLLGTQVLRLEDDGAQVHALVRSSRGVHRLSADLGVATLPPHLLARLPTPFAPDVVAALRTPRPVVTGKIGLEFGRRFWETDDGVYGGATTTSRAVGQIWYPSTGWLSGSGVVMGGYPTGAAAQEFSDRPHAGRLAMALEAGTAVHGPVYRDALRSSFSVDWGTQPYAEGAWVEWDRTDGAYATVQRPAGRWTFAGDWTSRAPGWQHGALESARAAVTQVHQRALAEAGRR